MCLLAGGTLKGVTGMGLPLVAVPGLAAFLGVPHALAVLTLPILATNAWQVWVYRAHRRGLVFLPALILAALFGVAVGTFLLTQLPGEILSLALALMVLAYVALRLLQPQWKLALAPARRLAPAVGLVSGALQGATGISAPVSATFISALRLPQPQFVFAVSTLFTGFVLAQIPSLALAGILTPERAAYSLVALLPTFLGLRLGNWLGRYLNAAHFDRLILLMLVLIALKLFADSGILV
ncbi:sulfite exporter TauE/SafE family protein [Afifella pfennigii]|uniref:sulfite exporter TauE/SafE family protein n=1 Tax=Afifella pfennigii TaxID=209897 RepID=UPI00068B6F7F|nr:sulfite exporter TauE/SafE family protein [Afifella pfennigii]